MGSDLGALNAAIEALASIPALSLIGVITAAGTIAMAMLQLLKELTPLRRAFQRNWIGDWIERRAHAFNAARGQTDGSKRQLPYAEPPQAEALLVELATGGDDRAFYDLTAEQLVAQMNAAAQAALDYPKANAQLLAVLSEGASIGDVALVISGAPSAPPRGRKQAAAASAPAPGYLDARNRVGNRVQRNLDGVQIAIGTRWKLWMQIVSIALSTTLIEAAVVATAGFRIGTFLITLPIGIVGGYFAPVTRDLVAALQTLRKP